MFCSCVLCAMAIKHQERITAANADGNSFNVYFYHLIVFYHFLLQRKKKEKTFCTCLFTNKQKLNHTCTFLNVCKTMSETFYDLI